MTTHDEFGYSLCLHNKILFMIEESIRVTDSLRISFRLRKDKEKE